MARAADCLVSLFAKAPVPGQVKTRLIPLLGAEEAARFHAQCVRRALATALEADVGPVEVCTPDIDAPFFHEIGAERNVSLADQGGGDLGERMHRALARGLQWHAAMILIGADCPALESRDLRDAVQALRDAPDAVSEHGTKHASPYDTVFAPAEDGGYVLIGARRSDPTLFANIRWSTDEVMSRTRANLGALGWRSKELRTLWDVDRPEDYLRLQGDAAWAR